MLSMLTQILQIDNSTVCWMVVGVNWLTMSQECPLLFLLYPSEFFFILENKLIDFADNSRVTVAESLNLDVSKVSEWCDL